jgi:uncharacterized paraquat-inducible protein A
MDRARELTARLADDQLEAAQTESFLRQLEVGQARLLLLVRALKCFYLSLGSFAAASLVSLLGAVFFVAHQELLRHGMLAVAIGAGCFAVTNLVYGSSLLVRETRMALLILSELAAQVGRDVALRRQAASRREDRTN